MNEQESVACAFDNERVELNLLADELQRVPHWLPATGLLLSFKRVQKILDDLYLRLESKPVIAVVGPTGSGKSTLVNALTGRDDTVETGTQRPTTRKISAIVQSTLDAQQLLDRLNHSELQVVLQATPQLRSVILLDTPDTDSMECAQHRPLLESALGLSDVLICVFDAYNPKRSDNIRALAEWVALFPGDNIFLVLNRCDRIQGNQLNQVVSEFQSHIAEIKAWGRDSLPLFCVSARDSLQRPEWTEGEKPLHSRNDFAELVAALGELGGGTFFADQRVARARDLRSELHARIRERAQEHSEELQVLGQELKALENEIAGCWIEMLFNRSGAEANILQPLLWGAVAKRWWGPVGLSAAFFRRVAVFATPFSLLRSFNPVKVISALIRSLRSLAGAERIERELQAALGSGNFEHGSLDARIVFQQEWPAIAERLIQAGFNPAVREIATLNDLSILEVYHQSWQDALHRGVERAAERLSGMALQLLLNAPVLAAMICSGYYLIRDFIRQSFLPLNFHLHVLSLILLLWLLSAWLLQYLVQRSIKRIPFDALEGAKQRASDAVGRGAAHDQASLRAEVDRVLRLAGGNLTGYRGADRAAQVWKSDG
ncbi:MAG: 50S ribosome-binding GTPase [Kiritimatiellae bacterium]|nr:50S ribosome-binding GTPase [Kiritimatiellia bacterium]